MTDCNTEIVDTLFYCVEKSTLHASIAAARDQVECYNLSQPHPFIKFVVTYLAAKTKRNQKLNSVSCLTIITIGPWCQTGKGKPIQKFAKICSKFMGISSWEKWGLTGKFIHQNCGDFFAGNTWIFALRLRFFWRNIIMYLFHWYKFRTGLSGYTEESIIVTFGSDFPNQFTYNFYD